MEVYSEIESRRQAHNRGIVNVLSQKSQCRCDGMVEGAWMKFIPLAFTFALTMAAAQEPKAGPKPPGPLLPLPAIPTTMEDYENPLFLFKNQPGPLAPIVPDPAAQPAPMMPVMPNLPDPAPAPSAEGGMSAEQRRLAELAMKVAPSVVTLRVWDEFGSVLASGVGTFVGPGGLLLTDAGLLHPEIADRVDYITTTAADGTNHRVIGFHSVDLRSGVALLQSDDTSPVPVLPIKHGLDFAKERICHVLAVSESRGLVLADARISHDDSLAGQGWLQVRGEDSPGAPGSPVVDDEGNVLAIVALRVPLKNWMNFALPADMAAYESQRRLGDPKPLSALPRSPKLAEVTKDAAFLVAFDLLTQKKVTTATQKLLALCNKYPRSAECWSLLGLAASELGAVTEAVNCQRKAVSLDPRAGIFWHELAMSQSRKSGAATEDQAQTLETLTKAAELHPSDKLTWLLLASRSIQKKDYAQADEALRQVTRLQPDYAPAFYLLAYTRSRLQDLQGMELALARCLELNPRIADAWYLQGLLLDKKQEFLQAAQAYKQATRLNPRHPNAWINQAHSFRKAGRDTEAILAAREHARRLKSS